MTVGPISSGDLNYAINVEGETEPIIIPFNDPIQFRTTLESLGAETEITSILIVDQEGNEIIPIGPPDLPVLPEGGISILDWAAAVSEAVQASRESTAEFENESIEFTKEMHNLIGLQLTSLLEALRFAIDHSAKSNQLVKDNNASVTTHNEGAEEYQDLVGESAGGEDGIQTTSMNNAVVNYNNGKITVTEYQLAAQDYNNHALSQNVLFEDIYESYTSNVETYNEEAETNQELLDEVNQERIFLGLETIDTDIPTVVAPGVYSLTLADVNAAVGAATTVEILNGNTEDVPILEEDIIPPTPPFAEVQGNAVAIFQNTLAQRLLFATRVDLDESFNDFIRFFIQTQIVEFTPPAYIENNTSDFIQTGSVDGQGTSLGTLTAGLNPNANEVGLDRALFDQISNEAQIPLSPALFDEIQFIIANLLPTTSLLSAIPAESLLVDRLAFLSPNGQAVGLVLGFAFINELLGLIEDGGILNAIEQRVEERLTELGASPEDISRAVALLTSAATLTLLREGIRSIAFALNSPGLAAQLLAQVDGLPITTLQQGATTQVGLNELLESSITQVGLQQSLIDLLALEGTLSRDQAEALIGTSLGAVLAGGPFSSVADLQAALAEELENQGLDSSVAATLAQAAAGQLRQDLLFPFLLDTQFRSTALNRGLFVDSLSTTLAFNRLEGESALTAITGALARILDGTSPPQTLREFQEAFTAALVDEGFTEEDAAIFGGLAIDLLVNGQISPQFSVESINQELLVTSLAERLTGVEDAENAAAAILATAISQGDFATAGEFRSALADAIVNAGIASTAEAASIAEAAILDPLATDPLSSPGLGTPLSLEELRSAIATQAAEILTPELGEEKAAEIADLIVAALIGSADEDNPLSILNQIEDSRSVIIENTNIAFDAEIIASFRETLRPSFDSFLQNSAYQDPANEYIYTMATGLMYNQSANTGKILLGDTPDAKVDFLV